MARQGGRRRRGGKSQPFLEKGLQVLALGVALWLASLILGGHPMLAAAAGGLRSFLWIPFTLGLGLLAVHLVLNKVLASMAASAGAGAADLKRSAAEAREAMVGTPARAPRPAPRPLRDTRFGHLPNQTPTKAPSPPAAVPAARPVDAVTVPYKQARWSAEVFSAIEWRRFEAVVEALFAQAGFETRSQSHGADGGVDIWLHSRHAEGPVAVVQCKHWQGKPVGVKEMREFLGVMTSKKIARGTYATTSRYTADALEFAKAHGINAQDSNGLLKLIAQRTPEQQARLLEVAYEGEYWKPTCASCGVKMTERTSSKDGARFWGCVNYPRCKRTMAIKAP